LTGLPVRAAGWFGPNDGLHTFSVQTANFRGRLSLQASLATDPQADDWFSILAGGRAYLEYPGVNTLPTITGGDTSIIGFNFLGNITWVRAIIDRDYLLLFASPMQVGCLGLITVLMNF